MTTVSDIVPQGILVKIANRIANSARGFARGTGSRRIPKAIKVGNVKATQLTASITIWVDTKIAPQAMIFEKGAKPHPIDARNAKNLVFWWERKGVLFVGKHVDHPGMRERPFMKPAKDRHRKQNLEELRAAVGRNMRLQIRAMAKKI